MSRRDDMKSGEAYGRHCKEAFTLFDILRVEWLADMASNKAVEDFDGESIEAVSNWVLATFHDWVTERALQAGIEDAIEQVRVMFGDSEVDPPI